MNGKDEERPENKQFQKLAKLSATSFVYRDILLFDGKTIVNHTNTDKKNIEKILRHSSEYILILFEIVYIVAISPQMSIC